MIEDMDILLMDDGRLYLTVPGTIPAGALTIVIQEEIVQLTTPEALVAQVDDVDPVVLDAIVRHAKAEGQLGLIQITDPEKPPTAVTHWAKVEDQR